MPDEEYWRAVVGWEDSYEVSDRHPETLPAPHPGESTDAPHRS